MSRKGAFVLILLFAGLLPVAGQAPDTVSFDELERGQTGYGLSVFSGREPERFQVEVLGVLRNSSPDLDYLLVRLSGHELEESGVVAGMSGSPVFFEDRLAGAVAFSWSFSQDAIAGVTPIAAMRDLSSGVAAGSFAVAKVVEVADLLDLENARERLEAELGRLRPALAGQGTGAIEWGFSGFAATTEAWLTRHLSSVGPLGEALESPGAEVELEPGSSVAAALVDGDLRMAATGTVTDRRGDDVLAFGHPFLGLGEIDVPMAESEVVTVLSSRMSSFKIANFGRIVGAFQEDRLAGIRGRIGAVARTIPLRVDIVGSETRRFDMNVARVEGTTPVLVALATLGAQEAALRSAGPMGLDLEVTFDLGPHGLVVMEQAFDGPAASLQSAFYVMAYTAFLLQNDYADVSMERIDVRLVHYPEPRTKIIVGGYAERTEVGPGDLVRVHVDMVPYRGEAERREVTVRIPSDLPAGRYSLLVGDGLSLDSLRLSIEPASPVRFDQALRMIRGFHSRKDLVVLGLFAGRGLAVAGEVMPRLPGTVQQVWSAAGSQSAVPLRFAVAQEHVVPLDAPAQGAVRIDLTVVRRGPMSSSATVGKGGSGAAESGGVTETGNDGGGDS